MQQSEFEIGEAIRLYEKYGNLHKVAKELHTSHLRLSKLLKENSVSLNNIGKRKDLSEDVVSSMINDYVVKLMTIGEVSKKYSVGVKKVRKVFKERDVKISKWNGHVKKEKPSHKVIAKTVDNSPKKCCPYCSWETRDVENKSNAFQKHLIHCHNIDVEEHLKVYPEDEKYLFGAIRNSRKLTCQICGKKLWIIDSRHLAKHGMTKAQYIEKYGDKTISDNTLELLRKNHQLMMDNDSWERKTSIYEKEIASLLEENNIDFVSHDRDVLAGLELDFLIGDFAIEFNGNKFHTEWFGGKGMTYHLNKTRLCNENGKKLLQIFEDEYVKHKNIVFSKILHVLGKDNAKRKVFARKCVIKEIYANDAIPFLEANHIQGFVSSSLYYAAYYENEMVGVMSFKKGNKNGYWELTRFATRIDTICVGVGGKLFKHFIKTNNPIEVKSFADRRWTVDEDNNLYTKLGFVLEKTLKPDYRYYNEHVDKLTRWHKFSFRKNILNKKYGLPMTMTESEMVKELGYDRIWDCGLFKYVWRRNNVITDFVEE